MKHNFYRNYVKRLMDIIVGLVGTLVFLLTYIFVAPAILLTDGRPVLYKSKRRGKRDKVFDMYKYRSMYVNAPDIRNADNSTFNGKNDPRVTKIGRILRETSLDEIPQFLNVLKGDMSFVGPRPSVPSMPYDQIPEYEKKKLEVKSGITGYTQAFYRNAISREKRFELDAYYAENVSFALDMKIIFRTFGRIFSRKGVYIEDDKAKTAKVQDQNEGAKV